MLSEKVHVTIQVEVATEDEQITRNIFMGTALLDSAEASSRFMASLENHIRQTMVMLSIVRSKED